jgi:hypothetical protein
MKYLGGECHSVNFNRLPMHEGADVAQKGLGLLFDNSLVIIEYYVV